MPDWPKETDKVTILTFQIYIVLHGVSRSHVCLRRRQALTREYPAFHARTPAETIESDEAGDIQVKLQLLSFATSFIQTCERQSGDDDLTAKEAMSISRMRDQFMSIHRIADAMLTNERRPEALKFLARYLLQECLETAQASGRPALETFYYCLNEVPDEATTDPAWKSICEKYTEVLRPTTGVSPSEHLRHLLAKFSVSKFEDYVIQFLFRLMDQLVTPDLYRLEWKRPRVSSPTESHQ